MMPMENHPLTLAYITAAKATTHSNMAQAMALVKNLERDAPEITRHQCKLAAEVLLERKM